LNSMRTTPKRLWSTAQWRSEHVRVAHST